MGGRLKKEGPYANLWLILVDVWLKSGPEIWAVGSTFFIDKTDF